MFLPRDGQEYAHITFSALPTGVLVEASLDRTAWVPTSPGDAPLERRVLLRGPDSTETAGLLVPADTNLYVRVADLPEHVIRDAGGIYLY